MDNFGIILILIALFYLLGKAADLVVVNLKKISQTLGIKIFFTGVILGFFTSLPELMVGINALANNVTTLSFGNLMGGIMVLFGLILGVSIILNRKITTTGNLSQSMPLVTYLFLPLLFGLDGRLNSLEGLTLIVLYFLLLFYLYQKNRNSHSQEDLPVNVSQGKVLQKIFFCLLSLAAIIILANLIIRLTLTLLNNFGISAFLTGLLLFALGTNLPEIAIAIRSWRKHIKDLSLNTLMGSALANVFFIGIFSFIRPITFQVTTPYFILMIFMVLLLAAFVIFYQSDKKFSRWEGLALLMIYFIFLFSQIIFSKIT